MKKIMNTAIVLVTIIFGLSFIITSCNKSKENTKTTEINRTDELSFYQYGYKSYKNSNNANLVIVRVKLWRPKYNCLHGLGICSIQFFPKQEVNLKESTVPSRVIDVPLTVEEGQNYIYLYYAQDVSHFSAFDLKFIVDQDIQVADNLFIKKGNYIYNSGLGDFGGYKIPLKEQ